MTGKLFCLILAAFILFGCYNGEGLPSTDNQILDAMLQEAPYSVVDLNSLSIDSLIVEEGDLLGFSEEIDDLSDGDDFLTSVTAFTFFDENLVIADGRQSKLYIMDTGGEIIRTYGRVGSGPGEFRNIAAVVGNDSYLYVVDSVNRQLRVLDKEYNSVDVLPDIAVPNAACCFDISNEHLFMRKTGVAADTIVQIFNVQPPFHELEGILPRFVPPGMTPLGFNYVIFQSNPFISRSGNHYLVAAYSSLPYLFIYNNNLEHIHTIALSGGLFDSVWLPESFEPEDLGFTSELRALQADVPSGVVTIAELAFEPDGSILMVLGQGREDPTIYRLAFNDDQFVLENSWKVFIPDFESGGNTKRELIEIDQLSAFSDSLYISNDFTPYIYRVNLN